MKNKYAHNSKISEAKIRQIVRLFAIDLNALQIAELAGVNRNTVNRYLSAFRERIARHCEAETPVRHSVAPDEVSGDNLASGERDKSLEHDTAVVLGLFRREGKIYTEIVPNFSRTTLRKVARGRLDMEELSPCAHWREYDGLVDLGCQKLFRLVPAANESGGRQFSGVESFWAFAKTRLLRFRGVQKHALYVNLKECEFRFNHRNEDIYSIMLKMLREDPLCGKLSNEG